jgi:Tol biopolymer transport system component
LSPNGRWLAYVSNRSGQSEIWVQAYPAGLPLRVSSNGGYQPLWSADGRELFYRRDGAVIAVAVETTTGEFSFVAPQQLFEGPYVQNEATRTYDVAPDGRFLMILPEGVDQSKDTGSIVVVQNFTDELKRRVPPSRK